MGDEKRLRDVSSERLHTLDEDAHPTDLELCAYSAGELPEVDREHLRDHLVVCTICRQVVADLADFPDVQPAAPEMALDDDALEAQWQALEARRKGREGQANSASASVLEMPPPRRQATGAPEGFRRSASLPWAAVVLLSSGLLAWGWSQGRGLKSTDLVVENPFTISLSAAPSRGGAEGRREVRVPADAGGVLWAFEVRDLARPEPAGPFVVEITGSGGRKILKPFELVVVEQGVISFLLPRNLLVEGDLLITLQTRDGEARSQYPVRVVFVD
jgi:hypothetical protein